MYRYIGTYFRVPVYLHWSVPFTILGLSALVSVTTGFITINFGDWSYWDVALMTVLYTTGLFVSLIVHECAHAVVARLEGVEVDHMAIAFMSGWCFTGVASDEEADLRISAAGSIAQGAMSFVTLFVCVMTAKPDEILPIPWAFGCLTPILGLSVIANLWPGSKETDGRAVYKRFQEIGWSQKGAWAFFLMSSCLYLFTMTMLAYTGYRYLHGG